MRQLVYISSLNSSRCKNGDLEDILLSSRRNNSREDVSGLLFFNGRRFLQALEGERNAVRAAFRRIEDDPRHRAIVVLSDREVAGREFGHWAMAHLAQGSLDADGAVSQIDALVRRASPSVRSTFESFVRLAVDA